jgi:hypothetical protein
VELLGVVLQHPANEEIRLFVKRIRDSEEGLLAILRDDLPKENFGAAIEGGKILELDRVVAGLIQTMDAGGQGYCQPEI